MLQPMNEENQLLVKDEPVEFEEKPFEVQDFKKLPIIYRKMYGIYKIEISQHVTMVDLKTL